MEPGKTAPPEFFQRYDPQVKEIVAFLARGGQEPPQHFGIEEVRAHPEKYRLPCWVDTKSWDNVRDYPVTSRDGETFFVRVYVPDPKKHGSGPFPVHLNFHGGGFVLGDLGQEASICSKISEGAGIIVIDVNYRHCPEVAWGKCFEDAWAALVWATSSDNGLNIKADSISIGGISAGGHLSLVLQHLARDNGVPLRLCIVTVPVTSNVMAYKSYTDSPFRSFSEFREDAFLPWRYMEWFGKYCTGEGRSTDEGVFPAWWFHLLQAPSWKGLCKTFIRTAEIDVLRDEGEAYGRKLIEAGHEVRFKRYLGMPHLFPYFESLDTNARYIEDTIQALQEAHA